MSKLEILNVQVGGTHGVSGVGVVDTDIDGCNKIINDAISSGEFYQPTIDLNLLVNGEEITFHTHSIDTPDWEGSTFDLLDYFISNREYKLRMVNETPNNWLAKRVDVEETKKQLRLLNAVKAINGLSF